MFACLDSCGGAQFPDPKFLEGQDFFIYVIYINEGAQFPDPKIPVLVCFKQRIEDGTVMVPGKDFHVAQRPGCPSGAFELRTSYELEKSALKLTFSEHLVTSRSQITTTHCTSSFSLLTLVDFIRKRNARRRIEARLGKHLGNALAA